VTFDSAISSTPDIAGRIISPHLGGPKLRAKARLLRKLDHRTGRAILSGFERIPDPDG